MSEGLQVCGRQFATLGISLSQYISKSPIVTLTCALRHLELNNWLPHLDMDIKYKYIYVYIYSFIYNS